MLAFVMGGAIIPMFIAWRMTHSCTPLLGGDFPDPLDPVFDRHVIIGAVFFGMGSGLVGLCPGPALASLSYGGFGGVTFLLAMIAGIALAPRAKRALDRGRAGA
tara:strand:+ start:185 stop:496 length:312 start_codon:yes stop_codon:yes gene_type:complete